MAPVLIGVAVLALLLLLVRAFADADPRVLVKGLRYAGAVVLGAFALVLVFRGGIAPALFFGSMAWGLATGGRVWPGGWPHYGSGGSAPRPGQTSSVRTPWIEMELDHDTGEMRGGVLKGTHKGMALDRLKRAQLIAFYLEAGRDDPETARLLEAYMDRTLGDWRRDAEAQQQRSAPQPRSGMTREEALKVLGLGQGASEEEIRSAHRRLMMQNHPDRGGSDYIAAKINEAKDVLLGH